MSSKWAIKVVPVSIGLQKTCYAHQVVKGHRSITVTHHTHQNYDYIHKTQIERSLFESTGIGRREPDLTPHPEAVCIMNALNAMESDE